MILLNDSDFRILLLGILSFLVIATVVTQILRRKVKDEKSIAVVNNLAARMYAWWLMIGIFVISASIGQIGSIILFALMSLLALREYIALAPTVRNDHNLLLWLFYVILPFHYFLLADHWYGFFAVFIPIYAFVWLQVRAALTGITDDFLDRTARIQWALIVFIYFLSHAPALLILEIPNFSESRQNIKLLFFLVLVVQMSDVFQYIVGKCFGKNKIAPNVSPNKTIEGAVGGILLATLLGASLFWITPFSIFASGLLAFIICIMGFAGGLIMSAIKRDRGLKDFGALLPGHGGMIDRIDSLCFAAPIFFHLTRYFYT